MRRVESQNAMSQERETATTVHLPFQQFDAVHLPFNLTIAPVLGYGCLHGVVIALNAGNESIQLRYAGCERVT